MENKIIITAMIVVKNEEENIKISLNSLLNQNFPQDKYEIIIIDGESTDNTLNNIKKIIDTYKDNVNIRILNNPKGLLASGWNIGIKAAVGKYVVRIDAHSKADKDFLKINLDTLLSMPKDVACVGGRLTAVSVPGSDETINKVLSSPFGIGNSKFRYSNEKGYVDTVAFGLYKKSVFEEVRIF